MKHTLLFSIFSVYIIAAGSGALYASGSPAFAAGQRDDGAHFAYPNPYLIMGDGTLSAEEMAAWLCASNPDIDSDFAREFAALYIIEAALEGVNHDVAFSQMCLETGFLRFDRLVTPDMNNFGGLGALNTTYRGERFTSIQKGVRAQVQHLKAYGSTQPLAQELVDPRYYYVRYGSAPTIYDLSGKWATDALYGDKLKSIIDRAYFMAGKNAVAPSLSSGR